MSEKTLFQGVLIMFSNLSGLEILILCFGGMCSAGLFELFLAGVRRINKQNDLGVPVHISKVVWPGQTFQVVTSFGDFIIVKLEDGSVRCVTHNGVCDSRADESFSIFEEAYWAKPGTYEFSATLETNLATRTTRKLFTVRPATSPLPAADDLHGNRAHHTVVANTN